MPRRDTPQKHRKDLFELACSHIDAEEASRKLKETDKYKKIKADADLRIEIQTTIRKMAKEGKGKIEIMTYLMDVYPYLEFTKYYGSWIDYRFKKLKIKDISNEGDSR